MIALRRLRRRGKVLVLAMTIYHTSYPLLLNLRLVFDQSALHMSKRVLVVVVEDISEYKF